MRFRPIDKNAEQNLRNMLRLSTIAVPDDVAAGLDQEMIDVIRGVPCHFSDLYVTGMPGVSAERLSASKRLFRGYSEAWLSGGKQIDGNFSRDPTNTGNTNVLQPGVIMGRIGAVGGAYAPSIYGLTTIALANAGTTVTAAAGTIAEILRRKGATGTFKITGPPAAAGVVRTQTVTYSALGTTTATITASGTNEVQTLDFANTPSGTFTLSIVDKNGVLQETAPITYSGTIATLLANIQAATDLVLAANAIVWTGTVVTAVAGTFSGTGYAGQPQTLITAGPLSTGGTISVTRTTAGASGAFVAGSFIQPVDGSENPLSFVGEVDGGILVTDLFGNNIVVPYPRLPVAGEVDAYQLVNWPADTSLQTWLMNQLSTASGGKFVWGDVY